MNSKYKYATSQETESMLIQSEQSELPWIPAAWDLFSASTGLKIPYAYFTEVKCQSYKYGYNSKYIWFCFEKMKLFHTLLCKG